MEVDDQPIGGGAGGQPGPPKRRKLLKAKKTKPPPPPQAQRQQRRQQEQEDDEDQEQEQPKQQQQEQPKGPPMTDADEGRTVFVRNVNFGSTSQALRAFFEADVGPVEECRIVRDRLTEHSRGQAFVKFRVKSDTDACLLRWAADPDGCFRLEGSTLRLCLAVTRDRLGQMDKTPPAGAASAAEQRKRPNAGKRNLHLARAGQLRRGSREAEGVPEAELALREQLERRAREALRNPDVLVSPTRLCVHGLPRDLADRDLRRAFRRLGGPGCRVTECRVMRDTARLDGGDAELAPGAKVAGRSRGFAFVGFGDHEHAMRAVEAARLGPTLLDGRRLVVQFSLERQSALKKKTSAFAAAAPSASAKAAAAVLSRIPKPEGAQGGIPRAPKRRARDRGAASDGAKRKQQARLDQRRQKAGRLSRRDFRRQRKEALVRDGRLK